MDYSFVRGFNVHGDWGAHGITEWLGFDKKRYNMMIKIAKARFPHMNTVRIWLSFDAYIADKRKYLAAVKEAADILTSEDLYIIPVFYNGWFGVPGFGSFTRENICEDQLPIYIKCTRDTTLLFKDSKILLFDIANEPFNNTQGDIYAVDTVVHFLDVMAKEIRAIDSRPITVGSQGYINENKRLCDIDRVAPIVDVFSLHPYNQRGLSQEEFDEDFERVLDYLKQFGKPYVISECIWGATTAEDRKRFLETEFNAYSKNNVGFICHALFTSPVADLHPPQDLGCENGLYMAFLDKDFNIRPYHDIFNKFS